jgi:hypothetical protein
MVGQFLKRGGGRAVHAPSLDTRTACLQLKMRGVGAAFFPRDLRAKTDMRNKPGSDLTS